MGRRRNLKLIQGYLTAVDIDNHGTQTAYTNHGCRCPECRQANTVYCAEMRQRRRASRVMVDGRLTAVNAPRHNSATYTNWGCRCPVCTRAWADAHLLRKKKR